MIGVHHSVLKLPHIPQGVDVLFPEKHRDILFLELSNIHQRVHGIPCEAADGFCDEHVDFSCHTVINHRLKIKAFLHGCGTSVVISPCQAQIKPILLIFCDQCRSVLFSKFFYDSSPRQVVFCFHGLDKLPQHLCYMVIYHQIVLQVDYLDAAGLHTPLCPVPPPPQACYVLNQHRIHLAAFHRAAHFIKPHAVHIQTATLLGNDAHNGHIVLVGIVFVSQ